MNRGIVLDIGNTRVKVGYFEEGNLLEVTAVPHADFPEAILRSEAWRTYSPDSKYLGLVSVGRDTMVAKAMQLVQECPQARFVPIDRSTRLPIGNRYGTPETLGMDRLCVAVAARDRAGNRPALVVNAGTAITYDYVDAAGDYRGGGISLGLRGRFRALHEYTAALPLVEPDGPADLVGQDTVSSIRSGVVNGVLAEVDGIIARYRDLAGDDLQVFLAGGDADFLGNHLKSVTFVAANLLLYGINSIILHHAQ